MYDEGLWIQFGSMQFWPIKMASNSYSAIF